MAHLITIPETRTDPRDITLVASYEEVKLAVIDNLIADGCIGHSITLVDEEDIEIEISEYIDHDELAELEETYT